MKEIKLIVCDLDGTLCDIRHRQHLAKAGVWDEFHAGIPEDTPRTQVLALLRMFQQQFLNDDGPCPLIFLTGRPEQYRQDTLAWLEAHADLYESDDYWALLMRPEFGGGSDHIVKQELLEAFLPDIMNDKDGVLILDDRDKVVAHFRDLGFECWQVQEGQY